MKASEYITELGLKNSSAKIFPKNTVLIAMYGATIGACSIMRFDATTNQACAAFLPSVKILPEYLFYYLKFRKPYFLIKGVGGAQPNISGKILKETTIPLPDLKTQQKIVAVLDRADRLRAACRQIRQELDQLAQSVFLDMFGDPVLNPKGLPTCKLYQIGVFYGGGTPSKKESSYYGGDIPWATIKDLKKMYLDRTTDYITAAAVENSAAKIIKDGAILLGVKSKILAHTLPISIAKLDVCFNQDVKGYYSDQLPSQYLYYHLKVDEKRIIKHARGVNTEGLTLNHLNNHTILLPPAEHVFKFLSIVDLIESLISENLEKSNFANNLFQSLLQKAFKGELNFNSAAFRELEAMEEVMGV